MNIILITLREIRKYNFIILITALFIFNSCDKENKTELQGNKNQNDKKENITDNKDSGSFIISYDLQGMINGKMDILRSGNNLKQRINSNIMGMENTSTIYILNNNVYSITEAGGQKFATKTDLNEYNSRKQTGETISDFKEFEKFLSDKNIIGSENILGYNSDIYDTGNGMNLTVYNKKYILKIKSPDFMALAVKLNNNPSFAQDEFKLPENIDFKNAQSKEFDKKSLDSAIQKK